MPNYLFKNNDTGEEFESFMTISEREQYLKDNPNIEQLINGFPGVADPTRVGRVKPEQGFRDLLKEVKKKNRGSKINTW